MRKTYQHHTPSEEGLERIRFLRQAFSDLHDDILAQATDSRERSVTLIHLETAAMWAVKAVVLTVPKSVVET
jgi:hypothetical protein